MSVVWDAIKVFRARRGAHLAAASTFYLILFIIPLLLLCVRLIGWVLGDALLSESSLISLIFEMFPSDLPAVHVDLQRFLDGPLRGARQYTWFNLVLLFLGGYSFLNGLWSGLFFMSEDDSFLKWDKHLKGILLLLLALILLAMLFIIPGLLHTVTVTLQNNRLALFLYENVQSLRPLLEWFRTTVPEYSFLTKSPLLYGPLLVLYFAFCYRTFFDRRIKWRQSLVASFSFVGFMIVGKSAFWIYFFLIRGRLISNYGNFYSLLVAIVWLYFLMCFFFFGAALCCVFRRTSEVKSNHDTSTH